jgi:hypothetical protein
MDLKSSRNKKILSSSPSMIPSQSINQSLVQFLRMVHATQQPVQQPFFNQSCTILQSNQTSSTQSTKISRKDHTLTSSLSQSSKTDQTLVETIILVSSIAGRDPKTWTKLTRGFTKKLKKNNNKIKIRCKLKMMSSGITTRKREKP